MSEEIIRTLRHQAWERAKGELNAMIATTWPDTGPHKPDRDHFQRMMKKIKEFIECIEGEGLQE